MEFVEKILRDEELGILEEVVLHWDSYLCKSYIGIVKENMYVWLQPGIEPNQKRLIIPA